MSKKYTSKRRGDTGESRRSTDHRAATAHATKRTREDWDIHHFHWLDLVALVGGIWLIGTVAAQISTDNLFVGGLAFIGGALTVLVGAASFQDNHPGYSWTMAAGGLLAVIGALVAFAEGMMLAFWSVVIGGAVVLFLAVLSATLKRKEEKHEPYYVTRQRMAQGH